MLHMKLAKLVLFSLKGLACGHRRKVLISVRLQEIISRGQMDLETVVEEFWFSRHLNLLCTLVERDATVIPDA